MAFTRCDQKLLEGFEQMARQDQCRCWVESRLGGRGCEGRNSCDTVRVRVRAARTEAAPLEVVRFARAPAGSTVKRGSGLCPGTGRGVCEREESRMSPRLLT